MRVSLASTSNSEAKGGVASKGSVQKGSGVEDESQSPPSTPTPATPAAAAAAAAAPTWTESTADEFSDHKDLYKLLGACPIITTAPELEVRCDELIAGTTNDVLRQFFLLAKLIFKDKFIRKLRTIMYTHQSQLTGVLFATDARVATGR